jgi:hypothetical protein
MAAMPMMAGTAIGIWVRDCVMKPAKISAETQQVARSNGTFSSLAPAGVAAPAWSASAERPISSREPHQPHHHEGAGHGEVIDEVHEGEAGARVGPDQHVGRIADQGRRAADVGGHHHGQEEGGAVDAKAPRNLGRHRVGEDHRRDVVEHRRQHAGEPDDEDRAAARIAARTLEQPVGQPGKDVGGLEHADQRHHGEQQQDDVEVDRPLRRLERDEAIGREIGDQPDQRHGADRHQDTVQAIGRQQGEHADQDGGDDALADRIASRLQAVHQAR